MEYVARKITRGKWQVKPELGDGISADAITGCLKTKDNTLSVWQCEIDRSDVKEVALALALSSANETINKIQIILLNKQNLIEKGFQLVETAGDTEVEDLKTRHLDIINLDLEKLTKLAVEIAEKARKDESTPDLHDFTVREVKEIIKDALSKDRVMENQIKSGIKAKL